MFGRACQCLSNGGGGCLYSNTGTGVSVEPCEEVSKGTSESRVLRWPDYEYQRPETRRQGLRRESSQVGALTRPAANNHSKQSVRGRVAWSEVNLSEVQRETAETSWSQLTRELNQLTIKFVHFIIMVLHLLIIGFNICVWKKFYITEGMKIALRNYSMGAGRHTFSN